MSDKCLSLSKRLRTTPFTRRVEAAGVKAYTVYNHMLLPTVFESLEHDYWHLCEHVQVWDVSCERQIEIKGPDSQRLGAIVSFMNDNPEDTGNGFEYRLSNEIYADLLEYLSGLTRPAGQLAGRHVDLYAFKRVGPHIDWVEVLRWRKSG